MLSALLIPALLGLVPSFAFPLAKRAVHGPVIATEFRDPSFVAAKAGDYVAYASSSGGMNVPTAHTTSDFNTWALENVDALPVVGAWSSGSNVVAPDVVELVSCRQR